MCGHLTQLVKVCVYAMRSWYGADEPRFDERAPLVDQHSLASNIILAEKNRAAIKHVSLFCAGPKQ